MSKPTPFSGPFDGERMTATIEGFTLTARLVADDTQDPPWEHEDGHGPVSRWTARAKLPGERILAQDRVHFRYYDAMEATLIAKRDGWDAPPYGGTAGEKAARAVEADFKRLKAWCDDEWTYVGVVLSVARDGVTLAPHAASLWGIESDRRDYLTDVANELADEALTIGRQTLETLCTCEEEEEAE